MHQFQAIGASFLFKPSGPLRLKGADHKLTRSACVLCVADLYAEAGTRCLSVCRSKQIPWTGAKKPSATDSQQARPPAHRPPGRGLLCERGLLTFELRRGGGLRRWPQPSWRRSSSTGTSLGSSRETTACAFPLPFAAETPPLPCMFPLPFAAETPPFPCDPCSFKDPARSDTKETIASAKVRAPDALSSARAE